MSRGVREDDRADPVDRTPTRTLDDRASARIHDVPADGLSLPRGEERDRVEHRGREYSLNAQRHARWRPSAPFGSSRLTTSTPTRRVAESREVTGVTWPSRVS